MSGRTGRLLVRLALVACIALLVMPLAGCDAETDYLDQIREWLANGAPGAPDVENVNGAPALTYPAGRSPKVFTSGWVFGAKFAVGGKDVSDQVVWSGSGTFNPPKGRTSRPTFNSEGANTITLSVMVGGKLVQKSYAVEAVSPGGYACVGMFAECPADAHGSPGDPLFVRGPITRGSPNVFVKGRAAARVGDPGIHAACAGANTFTISSGDSSVLINGKPAAMIGSTTRHCGGMGTIVAR